MDPKTEAWEFIHDPGYARGQGHAVSWTTVCPPGQHGHYYVALVDLPGFDPAKDIEVSFNGDTLAVSAERRTEREEADWSETLHISFTRSVRLPARPDADSATARYDQGILEISVPLSQPAPDGQPAETRRIEVSTTRAENYR